MPAAIILMVGGLLSCFAGYRLFRFVLAFFGFILGALATSAAMGTDQTAWMIGGAILGGLVGALILVLGYFVGVALIGAGIGAGAAMAIWAALGREPGMLPVLILSILGALAALALQEYVIIVSTAFGGAQTAIVGGAAFFGNRVAAEAAARSVYRAYPLDPLPATKWDLIGWVVLGTLGVIAQMGATAKGRK
jgi:Domain of unknown function (DUF4203)